MGGRRRHGSPARTGWEAEAKCSPAQGNWQGSLSQENWVVWEKLTLARSLCRPEGKIKRAERSKRKWQMGWKQARKEDEEWTKRFIYWITHEEPGMAPHSSLLAWSIPWTEEPGELHQGHPALHSGQWGKVAPHPQGIGVCLPMGK